MWTIDDCFLEVVGSTWNTVIRKDPYSKIMGKLKAVKSALSHWNRFVLRDVNVPIANISAAVGEAQDAISRLGFSMERFHLELKAQSYLYYFLKIRNFYIRINVGSNGSLVVIGILLFFHNSLHC